MMNQKVIMQKGLLLLTLLFVFCICKAQYYYNDVVNLKASNNIYANLIKNNVHEISATSMESDNTPTADFVYLKTINNNGATSITHTELQTGSISDDYDTYAKGILI